MPGTQNPSEHLAGLSQRVREALAISLRGCDELLPQAEWLKKLQRSEASGQPLRIKLGLDPTAPDIHIGHTVVLNKLRQLYDLIVLDCPPSVNTESTSQALLLSDLALVFASAAASS